MEEVTKDSMNGLVRENENLRNLVSSLQQQQTTNSLEVCHWLS